LPEQVLTSPVNQTKPYQQPTRTASEPTQQNEKVTP
ncbi:outer membrane permeability protein SanA, partial [Dickeya dadantii]|nr:outer membrane permeability protein SanA [Dickeya dadantii]